MKKDVDLSDIRSNDFVAHYLPLYWQPYARLMRIDRPIGIWLTLFPALASLFMVGGKTPSLIQVLVFSAGAFLMRSAGCVINDILDRRFDASVGRTRHRPLVNGALSVNQAFMCLAVVLLMAASLLMLLKPDTVFLALFCVPLMFLYPLCKRFTHWPQALLGATFNWGVLMASVEVTGSITQCALYLWIGCIFWQLGYDTLYAYSDRLDDLRLGLRSTAVLFAEDGKKWISSFYILTIFFWFVAAFVSNSSLSVFIFLVPISMMLSFQISKFDFSVPDNCNSLFRSNFHIGVLLLIGAASSVIS
ncbi:4-hydroxybenzoate octaprenyltransferase [Pseudomonas orientalis]|uniref:4-hydroxybenzoate octaprenyltransferase n=1 Tax=Pseudomonas orientalis TaxID=76758 RepID=A0A4Q7D2C2_9PSED|nr:4-hydroxybenzoate octaprenyltransferase [Pseudomonas orientalis]RZI32573.1 4-hydroxybenzoate octaprenyltransferase [Pseudomonas orientalis]